MDDTAEAEFRAFVAARQASLLRTAFLLTGSWQSGEDLLQTALTKAYLAWPRINDKSSADRYVRTTMSRAAISWWRRKSHHERPTAALPDRGASDPPDFDDRDEIWRVLATLPVRQRAVLVLRFYEDLTEAEIAHVLGCSNGTVKSHASRGLATLRDRLGDTDSMNGASR